ncbi:MAG: putative porin [Bacteroidales bacterium]|nr:putative porin [Bacteroidales bacterium]
MFRKNFILVFPVLISLFYNINGYSQDSILVNLDSAKIFYYHNDFETKGKDFLKLIDTTITNVEKYDPPALVGKNFATLGNPGLASFNMFYKPLINSGYKFGINAFNEYLFFNDSIKYHWVGKPYTHLYFIQGAKKEQNIHIDHAQNVASWFTVGLHFRYVNSPGYYTNQESDDKNFVFRTRFQTRNYRYMVIANYIHNKLKIEENGGILYDSVFEENVKPGRDGIKVNLNTANNYLKENSFYLKQFYKLSKRHRFKDTDSITENPFFGNINPGNISHSVQFSGTTYLYQQETSDNNGFYRFTNDSLNATYDSVHFIKLENRLSWTNSDNAKQQFLTFHFMLRHLYIENTIDSTKNYYSQLIPTGEVNLQVSDILKLYFSGDFVSGNYNVGDFNIKAGLNVNWKFGRLNYQLQNASQDPERIFQSYTSNHFNWDNDFKKQYYLVNRLKYNYKTIWAGLNIYAIENFTHFDSLGFPAQLNKNLQIIQATFRKLFKLGNWSLDTRIVYQKASNSRGIRFPDLMGNASLFYTKDLFREAAIIQTGLNVFYNTPYYSYAYMPASRSFYIQDKKELGDYFYGDAFLNLQIKRARLFLKYYNLGYLLNDFRYYTVPSYPMKDGGIRFGVSWMFYD